MQAVVQELRGEKIDIVHWTPDPAEFVCRAIAPAKVAKIIMDEDEHNMEVIVPDDQLSLAIGKRGQNVTLASRLTSWRLDVRGESEADEEVRQSRADLMQIEGVSDVTAELLMQHGFKAVGEVAASDPAEVAEVEGIGADRAVALVEAAKIRAAEEAAEAAAAAAAAEAAAAAGLAAGEGEAELEGDALIDLPEEPQA